MFRKYYEYEQIRGSAREQISLIPEEAFREAAANALVHRTWDVNSQINIAMFHDKIQITSPGGLPKGISEEEYLRGGISILRNPKYHMYHFAGFTGKKRSAAGRAEGISAAEKQGNAQFRRRGSNRIRQIKGSDNSEQTCAEWVYHGDRNRERDKIQS